MIIHENEGWYSLELPDAWVADEDEDPAAFYDPEGAGALHITVQKPGPLKSGDRIDAFVFLRAFLTSVGVHFDERKGNRFSQETAEGASYEFASDRPEGRAHERFWMLTNHAFVLFLSYACREEDRGVERETVDEIVKSVRLT